MSYASSDHWNQFFTKLKNTSTDLDWGNQWTKVHLPFLNAAKVKTVLDLGCGTGNDVLRLVQQGFTVTGLDFSDEAVRQGREKSEKLGLDAQFVVADMAKPLPFNKATFDAVMSNVAIHMFSDRITRELFKEIRRIIRPNGLFVFHVNSTEDVLVRAERHPPMREIEPNYFLERHGQTMHFFSQEYLLDLLSDWKNVELKHYEILHEQTGKLFKRVWWGKAIQPD
ncbi:Ubiqui/menaqui biosynthesis C-methylase UbiE [Nostoc flagelliforme CCNUN1]|uniref:Ubiqui/menaqui biosynthesis C-methylase UbiE n=1 Tax=Nostoc flagelliforme CCNUN1 TaxID=2038116 RepID=A0A2K8T2F2_9NOSO|nr:class I SAM-dependent methyltransferase [Nostoc flagelliforme]AUB41888.1 Ubiqui/menaqui biosynthesis C-methylase UbiE [Nostoc flagelliforme CCNUN1]